VDEKRRNVIAAILRGHGGNTEKVNKFIECIKKSLDNKRNEDLMVSSEFLKKNRNEERFKCFCKYLTCLLYKKHHMTWRGSKKCIRAVLHKNATTFHQSYDGRGDAKQAYQWLLSRMNDWNTMQEWKKSSKWESMKRIIERKQQEKRRDSSTETSTISSSRSSSNSQSSQSTQIVSTTSTQHQNRSKKMYNTRAIHNYYKSKPKNQGKKEIFEDISLADALFLPVYKKLIVLDKLFKNGSGFKDLSHEEITNCVLNVTSENDSSFITEESKDVVQDIFRCYSIFHGGDNWKRVEKLCVEKLEGTDHPLRSFYSELEIQEEE